MTETPQRGDRHPDDAASTARRHGDNGQLTGDKNGMVAVRAVTAVYDNGKRYRPGETLHMHRDLVPAHLKAGQVALAGAAKEQGTPADRQVTSSRTK